MAPRKLNSPRTTAALIITGIGMLLGLALRQPGWRPGEAFLGWSYDALHALSASAEGPLAQSPVVIVYLDLHSYLAEKLDPARPWPRDLHARLVRRLGEANAKAVVFDIIFGGPGVDPGADEAFAGAIRESGRVILAGQADAGARHGTDPRVAWARWVEVEAPWTRLATQAVAWGVANHRVDDDFVVRQHFPGLIPEGHPSLSWAAAQWMALPATRRPDAPQTAHRWWIRYYGPPRAIPGVSYAQALRPDGVPDEFFRDRVVLVGARPMAEMFHERQDEFRSPYHSWRHKERFMPGVEVHATELLNLMREDWLGRLTPGLEVALFAAAAAVFGFGLVALRPAPATVAALGGGGLVLALARTGFGNGTWFPWLIVVAGQAPVALFGSWLFRFGEWHLTRRRLEAERRVAERRIREQAALIDKANDAILVQDLEGRVVYANASAERLYGWSLPELQSDRESRLGTDPARWIAARAAALELGEWRGELSCRSRAGRDLVVESRWTLIRDDQGQPRSLLVIDTDVTEKRQLEAEAVRLQRAEAVGSLASGMAHDLNNALAPVLLGSQILARETPNEEARRVLQLMEAGTRRGVDMVRQVLLFARGRQGERVRLDLGPLVREMETLIRETFPANVSVSVSIAGDRWEVNGNSTELHQVLLNLCINARDAMPHGGTLDIALDNAVLGEAETARLPGAWPGEFVCLLVADSGTGIPAEVIPRIFDPFFTTKPEGIGTGLGLSTTARLVKAHGGFIQVESKPGEGTSFEVYLPRYTEAAPETIVEPTEAGPLGNREWILVADDDLAVLEVLRRGLTDRGYRVITASGGAEAVATFASRQSEIAAVICDVAMPGLDGPEAAAAIRRLNPAIPWLFMSGGTRRPGEGAGDPPTDFLSKPASLDVLLRRLHGLLHRREKPQPAPPEGDVPSQPPPHARSKSGEASG